MTDTAHHCPQCGVFHDPARPCPGKDTRTVIAVDNYSPVAHVADSGAS